MGTNFNRATFTFLFETLCVLFEIFFNELMERMNDFFLVFAKHFLKHNNKYIRQFSLQLFSYFLSNLSEKEYQDFISYLLQLQIEGFFDSMLSLA